MNKNKTSQNDSILEIFLEDNEKLLSLRFEQKSLIFQDLLEKIQNIFLERIPEENIILARKDDEIFLLKNSFSERLGFGVGKEGPVFGLQGTYIKKERFKFLINHRDETIAYSGIEGILSYLRKILPDPEYDEFLGPTVVTNNPILIKKESYKENYISHISWAQEKLIIYDVNLINNNNIEKFYDKIISYVENKYEKEILIKIDIMTTNDGINMPPYKLYKKLDKYGIYTQIRTAFVQVHNWDIDMVVRICVKKNDKYTIWESI